MRVVVLTLTLALASLLPEAGAQEGVISRLFAATSDGPFVTYSWGEHWTKLRVDLRGLSGSVDAFVCLGPSVFTGGSEGVFVSDDFGESYRRLPTWPKDAGPVTRFLAARLFSLEPTLFVGTEAGLYRSNDGGLEWVRVAAGQITSSVRDLAWPGPDLFVATDGGLYHSLDRAERFTRVGDGLPDVPLTALAVSRFFGLEPVVFVGASGQGLYKSTDGGKRFAPAGAIVLGRATVNALFWWNSLLIVGTDRGLYLSDDGGEKFRTVKELEGLRVLAISVPAAETGGGSDVIVGTNEGVLKSSDGALTFRRVHEGLGRPVVHELASFPMPVQDREQRPR